MKKVFLSILLVGFASYANAQKSEVAEAKKKWSIFEITSGTAAMDKKIVALNAGLLNTTTAIANEKTKDSPEAWAYRALFSSAIALTDTLNEANSLSNQKIAEEAIGKATTLDIKGTEKGNISNAETNVKNAILLRGMRAYKKADYDGALIVFNQMIALNPQDTSMYLNAGVTAKLAKKYPEAIRHFKKVISFNTPDAKNIYSEIISLSLNEMKDTAATMELTKEALSKFPDDGDFIGNQTDIYIATKEYTKAQESLKKLIAKDGSRAVYHFLMGETYYRQALMVQDQKNKVDTKNVKEFNALTAKIVALIDESLPFYLKSLELDPKFVPTLETLKQIYGFKNDNDKFNDIKKRLDAINANQ